MLSAAELKEWHDLRMVAVPKAIEPYYSLDAATAVPLYAGPLLFPSRNGESREQADGMVSFELRPAPHVVTRASVPRPLAVLHALDEVACPQLPAVLTVPEPPQMLSAAGNVSWPGPVRGWIVGKPAAARAVTFHLVNFMEMHGAVIADRDYAWAGRVVVDVGPWHLTIDARPDLRESLAILRDHGGYAVTHTCALERRDGRVFAFARCQELLTCLTWCLWFCRASAPAVIVPVGFDTNGRAIWSRWAAPYADPLPDNHWQWFDEAYGAEQLSMLLPLFFAKWNDPAWRITLQRAVRYYADAAVMGTLQRNIVLAQVALESLAFAHLVKSSQRLLAGQFKAPVSRHIKQLLIDFDIPTTIPRSFYGLRKVRANSPWDGPAAIAWLRNDIVHVDRGRVHTRRGGIKPGV
jgi:hypothetical protein